MSDFWIPLETSPVGRRRFVPFGPFDFHRLPARFTHRAEHSQHPLRVTVAMSFDDSADRVRVDSVTLERTDGQSVAPSDMTRLQLAQVVHDAAVKVAEPYGWAFDRRHPGGPLDDDEVRGLAQIYWYEYVTWGKPREQIMAAFELTRPSASRWIRKARDRYGLPGPHQEGV
ncbi:MAG: hypothetical protein GEU93_02145 [Propionibacteriales bacterium]|nr:hypothetical protein [Propionibacteriales bacterium]